MKTITIVFEQHYSKGNPFNKKIKPDKYISSLCSKSGLCCLGFTALDFGFEKNEIKGFDAPYDLIHLCGNKDSLFKQLFIGESVLGNSRLSRVAMALNDAYAFEYIDDCELYSEDFNQLNYFDRMGLLISLFMEHGLDLKFVHEN